MIAIAHPLCACGRKAVFWTRNARTPWTPVCSACDAARLSRLVEQWQREERERALAPIRARWPRWKAIAVPSGTERQGRRGRP